MSSADEPDEPHEPDEIREYPSFEDVSSGLRALLESRGFSAAIAWIKAADLTRDASGPTVTLGPEIEREAWARGAYARAVAAGLGVVLEAVCTAGDRPCVVVYGPRDEEEAARLLMGNLVRLAVPRTLEAAAVRWPVC
jgi:hypothetical protein